MALTSCRRFLLGGRAGAEAAAMRSWIPVLPHRSLRCSDAGVSIRCMPSRAASSSSLSPSPPPSSVHTILGTRDRLVAMSAEQKDFYDANGYVKVPQVFDAAEMEDISAWVAEMAGWEFSDGNAKWLHHLESTAHGPRLSRTENFVSYHTQISRLLMAGIIPALVGDALGEDAFLYKEKLNWKHPGGAGYAAHQDAPAYKEISHHCTCLLSIDDSTISNGCLEFAAGRHLEGLIGLTADGIIDPSIEQTMQFEPCETRKGDVVIFSSYVPHRSLANTSDGSRNLLYLTYNAQSEGYKRDEYYRNKRETMDAGAVSLIKHFQGVVVHDDTMMAQRVQ